jgi:hypothetical protein
MPYRVMTLHKVTEFYTKWFRVCPTLTSKLRTAVIYKSFAKEKLKNYLNKTFTYIYDLLLYQTSFL